MMRRQSCTHTLIPALILATFVLVSQTSSAESDPFLVHNPSEWVAQTVTQSGRVRVTITKTKPKLYLAKSQRPIRLLLDDQDDDYYDDLPDVQVGYRRPELVNTKGQVVDNELSDEIKLRLALARLKALKKHQETWG